MTATNDSTAYRTWSLTPVRVGNREIAMASKPGVLAHATGDPAATMLAESVEVAAGETLVQFQGGNGLLATTAAERGASVWVTDRHLPGVEAGRRTLHANGASATVLHGLGAQPLPRTLRAQVVAVRIPTEKMALRQLLADAWAHLDIGGRCYLAGANDEGAKSAAKMLERLFGHVVLVAQHSGHRTVVATKATEAPVDAQDIAYPIVQHDTFHSVTTTLGGVTLTLASRPGVFSWDHLDEATALLADAISVSPGESVLDLGCGSGALGLVAATRSVSGRIVLLDADAEAVRSAQRSAANAGLGNCRVMASDIGDAVDGETFDVVVTNPPFHVGKATDLSVPRQFIADAHTALAPGGRLYLVANRTLPYEALLRERFGAEQVLHDGQRFKVLAAIKSERGKAG